MGNKRQREIRAYQELSGLNYTRAARELDRYTDPGFADVVAEASALLDLINAELPTSGFETGPTEADRALALSARELSDIIKSAGVGSIHWDEYDAAIRVTEWLQDSGPFDGDLSADTAVELVDTIRAVRRKTCRLGHSRVTPCSPTPQRALLDLGPDQHQGCFHHIAESMLDRRSADHPTEFTIISPPPIIAAIDHLASSESISLPEDIDLEADWGEALNVVPVLELEFDLSQHTRECAEEAITAAYSLGHDDPATVRQAAAQVLEASPQTCVCPNVHR